LATKYQDKRGYWYVKYKAADGKWKAKNCGKNATRYDAETIRKHYDAEELNRRHSMPVRMVDADLQEQIKKFWENEIPRSSTGRPKSRKSIITYQAIMRGFADWCSEKKYATYADITPERARKFFDHLISMERSASNITKNRQTLIRFWKWSKVQHFTQIDPFSGIKNPKREKKAPHFFTKEELVNIFKHAKPPYDDVFRFLYLTGLRIGELGNLEWGDYIESLQAIKLRVIEGNKCKREEVLPLNKDAIAIIQKRRDAIESDDSRRYVFVNMEGTKLDNANIYRHLQVTMKSAQVTKGSPHTFRHTCASHLVIDGVSLYIVKEILRHASIRETEIYAHLSDKAVRSAIERLNLPPSSES